MEKLEGKGIESLTDAELSAFRTELAKHVSAEEVHGIVWARRALLKPDGVWHLTFRRPKVRDLQGTNRDCSNFPWGFPNAVGGPMGRDASRFEGMQTVATSAPLAEAVSILQGPGNPENEIERRQRLFDDAWRAVDRGAELEAEARKHQKEREDDHRRRRPERWGALPQLQKALYVVAASPSDGFEHAFTRLAAMLQAPPSDHRLAQIPRTFEMDRGQL